MRRTSPQLESEDDDDSHDSKHTNLRSMPESGIDEEVGDQDVAAAPGTSELDPVTMCREQSSSAWLYFPHLELEFLLFVFHGVVASQAAAMPNVALCPWLYPVVIVSVSDASLVWISTFEGSDFEWGEHDFCADGMFLLCLINLSDRGRAIMKRSPAHVMLHACGAISSNWTLKLHSFGPPL